MSFNSLEEARKAWEKGLRVVCVINRLNDPSCYGGVVKVVVQRKKDNLHNCYRYFMIGDSWNVSEDHKGISADFVLSWLHDRD